MNINEKLSGQNVSVFKRIQVPIEGQEEERYPRKEWKSVHDYVGKFIQFGLDVDEGENGLASYSVGLILKDNGRITMIEANLLQFDVDVLDTHKSSNEY